MKPAPFGYTKARSVEHALALLQEHTESRLLAGGQSLIATLNMRLSAPRLLIDINGLDELKTISLEDGILKIGALVRYAEAERSAQIMRDAPLLALALPHIAHPAIRNRGTIGGSIAYADPAAELPACLLALSGEVEIIGPTGKRIVKADDFFKGLFETALGAQEMLTTIRIPAARPESRYGFAELARRRGDYAMIGLAACARAEGTKLRDVRLAFFGIGTTPVRARGAESALERGSLEEAVDVLGREINPQSDLHASSAMKKHLAGVLLRRVAQQLSEHTP